MRRQLLTASALGCVAALTPSEGLANPEDGVVAAGSATIVNAPSRVDIHQHSERAVIDWRSFDIAPNETTQFHQPSSSSFALNRVKSNTPSSIAGALIANGNVAVVNPNGVLIQQGAKVDVNSLVVSSADTRNEDFMVGGPLKLDIAGKPDAAVINQGTITAKEAGLVGLVAPHVENSGVIEARLGKVALASGDTAVVDLAGDGLISLAVSDSVAKQLVRNSGAVSADGGTVLITAAAGRELVDSLVAVEGTVRAQTVAEKNGVIVIASEGSNAVKGNVTAEKGKKQGASTVLVANALIDASGRDAGERGGRIEITGDNVALLDGTVIDASGHTGKSGTTAGKKLSDVREGSAGGDIRVGGDYLGQGETSTAKNLYVSDGVLVLNDALETGDAGRTIFWSDGDTSFYGNVYARALGGKQVDAVSWNATAGGKAGDGGFVETSGHKHLDAGGYVDLTASNGEKGTYFLDPTDITIYGNVDPTFVSTDGTLNLNSSLRLWLDSSDTNQVTLTYNSMGTTATGTSGSNTITVSSATGLVAGARIRLGAAGAVTTAATLGADTYTIASIAGTTVTLTSNLTTSYAATTVRQGYVNQVTDKSSAGNTVTQGTAASMPLWISNGQNGLGVMQFGATSSTGLSRTTNLLGGSNNVSFFVTTTP
ncbi:MAG: filamentous hemagglutinin N-terminal domain-containing protein, partial [Alphaproteobacteria bacterium]